MGKSSKPHATVWAANQVFMTAMKAVRYSVVRNRAPTLLNQTPIIIWPSWLKTAPVSDVQSADEISTKARIGRVDFSSVPYARCICLSPVWLAAVSFRCSTSSCSLINALTVQEGNSISGSACLRYCCHGRLPIMWGKGNTVFQLSVIPKFNYSRILS